jgi:hypothetical protein
MGKKSLSLFLKLFLLKNGSSSLAPILGSPLYIPSYSYSAISLEEGLRRSSRVWFGTCKFTISYQSNQAVPRCFLKKAFEEGKSSVDKLSTDQFSVGSGTKVWQQSCCLLSTIKKEGLVMNFTEEQLEQLATFPADIVKIGLARLAKKTEVRNRFSYLMAACYGILEDLQNKGSQISTEAKSMWGSAAGHQESQKDSTKLNFDAKTDHRRDMSRPGATTFKRTPMEERRLKEIREASTKKNSFKFGSTENPRTDPVASSLEKISSKFTDEEWMLIDVFQVPDMFKHLVPQHIFEQQAAKNLQQTQILQSD